ncbi:MULTISPECIES: DUF1292 domain-containing protein [unclassified Pelosinus]|jgi:uncharacterized protein YrzB (UPF0473 family)|uniref:DUF1292 domain-containing protein n=1 Tax=unclassified Pelosinus TaxID=2629460 RepID=UPI0004D1DC23|nr:MULTISPECIES: DUF1292 domain-containing protein [unclassified Pelosinus]AIF51479.1 protein of unknown function DUF1292 [Pelosinus sp. UFO1]GMA99167.1 hypothetical protein PIPA1_19670 [Pelosinus sp. IPA-1]
MADFEKEDLEELDEELVVVMTDEEGNEYYYREEMIVPVGDKQYAILIPIEDGDDCECQDAGCGCSDDEVDVYIARIDTDENGEEIYVDPTDEEFEDVRKAYEELMVEEEDEAE